LWLSGVLEFYEKVSRNHEFGYIIHEFGYIIDDLCVLGLIEGPYKCLIGEIHV
jgi:hypothetical protein